MSEDSSSFELVNSPVMVFPADMTSTPEKQVQPKTDQEPDPATDATATAREPNIEQVKVKARTEEPGKEELNSVSGEKPEEPEFDDIENRFRDKLQKKKLEGSSRGNGEWKLRAPEERSWRVGAFVTLVLAAVGLCLCL